MSDRQDPPDAVSPEHRPDRPIATAGEDRLGRGDFVRRLARALVRDGRASGVVVGLTGPWGSGKSSILNLLEAEIKVMHAGAVVVRFDPWLVSGRDDVISQFFAELLATITEVGTADGRTGDTLLAVGNKLAGYAKDIGHAANFLLPGAGAAVAGLAKAAEAATARDTSLARQRRDLAEMLAGVAVPIVVLVDELDRVEDGEVRAVAQLVRAVADFPGLSYLLAYDRRRVIEALGGTEDGRGSAYLEKIVQLELPLPITLSGETDTLLAVELDAAVPPGLLPVGWHEEPRFHRIVASAVGVLLATPRDVRRVCGMYAVLAPMVAGEVDWADLLGYTILLAKAPEAIEAVRQQPRLVVRDAPANLSVTIDWEQFLNGERANPSERLLRLGLNPAAPSVRLLGVLFPLLNSGERDRTPEPVDGLRRYRPLMTLLRLGVLPGAVRRSEIQETLALDPEAKHKQLQLRFFDGRLALFLDRLIDVYGDLADHDPEGTLRVLGSLARGLKPETPTQVLEARRYCMVFDNVAKCVATSRADGVAICQSVLTALIRDGEFDGPATLLRHQFFAHGLFGREAREPGNNWLPEGLVGELSAALGEAIVGTRAGRWFAGRLLERVRTPHALLLANEVGVWSEDHRADLSRRIETDEQALQRALLLFFGDGIVEVDVLNRFVDAQLFLRLVSAEAEGPAWEDPTMVATRATALRVLERG
ncbi:KAP family P-loop NTPase fold protein [Azospirillum doebereinerae]